MCFLQQFVLYDLYICYISRNLFRLTVLTFLHGKNYNIIILYMRKVVSLIGIPPFNNILVILVLIDYYHNLLLQLICRMICHYLLLLLIRSVIVLGQLIGLVFLT